MTREDAAVRLAKSLNKKIPYMPDPDATLDDTCAEIEITWRECLLVRKILMDAEKRT